MLCGHAGGLPLIDPHFYLHNHTLVGVNLAGYRPVEMRRMHTETQAAIDELDRRRSLPVDADTGVIEFDEVPGTLADLAARRTTGRIVVQCAQ